MSDFNATDYFQILIRSIRKGVAVPFDCFLYLQANNRIIRYVGSGNVFPEEKLAKLEQHAFTNLYLRREDMPVYEQYLREFLSSPEGAQAVKDLAETSAGEEVVGIPATIAEEFKSLLSPLKLSEDFVASTVGTVNVTEEQSLSPDEPTELAADGGVEGEDEDSVPGDAGAGSATTVEVYAGTEAELEQADEEAAPEETVEGEVEAVDETDVRSLILNVIKSQVSGLEEKLRVGGEAAPEDDLTLIRQVTQKIHEEMTRVRGKGDAPPDKTVIREVTQNVGLEIQRIRGLAARVDGDRAERLNRHAEDLEAHLKTLAGLLNEKNPAQSLKKADAAASGIDNEIWEIKRLYSLADDEASAGDGTGEDASVDEAGAVGEAIAGMIAGLEEVLGVQIEVQPVGAANDQTARQYLGLIEAILAEATRFRGLVRKLPDPGHVVQPMYEELFAKVTELHQLCSSDIAAAEEAAAEAEVEAEGAAGSDGGAFAGQGGDGESVPAEFAKRLAALVSDQERVIIDLNNRLKTAKSIYGEILRKWDEIQTKARAKMSSTELKLAQQLSDDFRTFGTLYLGANAASVNLKDLTDQLADAVGVQKEELDNSEEPEGEGARSGIVQPNLDGTDPEGAVKSAADLNIPDGPRDDASDEELRSEYRLLLVQLQNAKSLLESNEKKIGELARAHSQTAGYAESLEKELGEKTATFERLRDKSDEIEGKSRRMMEAMDSADRNLILAREEIRAKDEVIRNLNDKVLVLERELKQYRTLFKDVEGKSLVDTATLERMEIPDDLKSHIKDMETHLRRYEAEIESKRGEIRELRKEIVKLNGKVQDNTLLKQQMAQKLDKIRLDIETSRRAEAAMNRKIVMVTNLLDESRKTIGKLTGVNEELRRDRMEYMAKTNQAMRDYKEMMSKANSLDRHVQAEIQRNQSLGEQNETLKSKQKELATRAADLQKENMALEAEIKRLRRLVENAGGSVGESGELNPLVLQRRIEELEKEKKTISKWYADEQRKVAALTQQLKQRGAA